MSFHFNTANKNVNQTPLFVKIISWIYINTNIVKKNSTDNPSTTIVELVEYLIDLRS